MKIINVESCLNCPYGRSDYFRGHFMIELVQTHKFSLVDGKLHRDNMPYHLPDTFWEPDYDRTWY